MNSKDTSVEALSVLRRTAVACHERRPRLTRRGRAGGWNSRITTRRSASRRRPRTTDIKRAYRKLARKYHPDLNPGDKAAEAKFKEINEANEVLGDPEKRRKYDELGANWRMYEQAQAPTRRTGAGRSGWRVLGGGGGTSYRTMTPDEMQEMFGGGGDPFSDFFHTFFGGGGRRGAGAAARRAARPRRGQDLELRRRSDARRSVHAARRGASSIDRATASDRTVEVRIPAGVKDGARVRAAGEGAPAPPAARRGDLYLHVRVAAARAVRAARPGSATRRCPCRSRRRCSAARSTVPTLAGSTLRLKVPELTRARPRVPPARTRHADGRQADRTRRPVRDRRDRDSIDSCRPRNARTTRR